MQHQIQPQKIRELEHALLNSNIWNHFKFRDGDIIIATYPKSGTTWMQQIVAQLLFQGQEDLDIANLSPWVELQVIPQEKMLAKLEAQVHRRFLKTHLPLDALVFSPYAKYIYVARDGRDLAWSLYHQQANVTDEWHQRVNNSPMRTGLPLHKPLGSVRDYFQQWLDKDGYPFWSFWEHVRSWWDARELENVMIVHFKDLKQDLPEQIERIAAFLEIPIELDNKQRILEHCSFSYMKQHANQLAPRNGSFLQGGAKTFFNKGENGRWQAILNSEEIQRYEQIAEEKLGKACADWLKTGNMNNSIQN